MASITKDQDWSVSSVTLKPKQRSFLDLFLKCQRVSFGVFIACKDCPLPSEVIVLHYVVTMIAAYKIRNLKLWIELIVWISVIEVFSLIFFTKQALSEVENFLKGVKSSILHKNYARDWLGFRLRFLFHDFEIIFQSTVSQKFEPESRFLYCLIKRFSVIGLANFSFRNIFVFLSLASAFFNDFLSRKRFTSVLFGKSQLQ